MAKAGKTGKAGHAKGRHEQRFTPQPTTSPAVAKAVGGVGAAALGAGVWAQFGHDWMENGMPPFAFAPALLAGGAVAFGVAVWLGTSGEAVLRVGAGGIGIEKGKQITRIPWYEVERVVWDPEAQVLSVLGKDEAGGAQQLAVRPRVHPAALAWIVKEARERIPGRVDVPDAALGVPEARQGDGEDIVMDAVQVVGKRCAATDRILAYEPDARVCPRCERVYHKLSVPTDCACGASLQGLRATEE
jgi:hypothetical protein